MLFGPICVIVTVLRVIACVAVVFVVRYGRDNGCAQGQHLRGRS
jgi:hypothetical protein